VALQTAGVAQPSPPRNRKSGITGNTNPSERTGLSFYSRSAPRTHNTTRERACATGVPRNIQYYYQRENEPVLQECSATMNRAREHACTTGVLRNNHQRRGNVPVLQECPATILQRLPTSERTCPYNGSAPLNATYNTDSEGTCLDYRSAPRNTTTIAREHA
jgi:hypothetical protein